MNRTARLTIERIREGGFRVLFECNPDASIAVMALSAAGEAFIVRGRLCDDSRAVAELARMVGLDEPSPQKA
jgi:hypothetical protein